MKVWLQEKDYSWSASWDQLREAQLSNLIFTNIWFAQKSLESLSSLIPWLLSLITSILAAKLILKVQRTSIPFKTYLELWRTLEACDIFGILISIWIWLLVFDTPMFQSLALYWFSRCKECLCPLSPDFGFWEHQKFLAGVWYLDCHLDMDTALWYDNVPNFGSLSTIWRWKENSCPLCVDMDFGGCCRLLTRIWHPNLNLGIVTGLRHTHFLDLGCMNWFWRWKEYLCPLLTHWDFRGFLRLLTGFNILILIKI